VDLRNHLFETLESLKDKEEPMALDRAKAIAAVAQVVINSAKVEVDYLRLNKNISGSGFLGEEKAIEGPNLPRLVKGKAHHE